MLELHDFAAAAKPYAHLLDAACVAAGYSQLHLFTQICAESGWDATATSPTGALGLCQIEPATAAQWHCNPLDPASALNAMALAMKDYLGQFGADFALALAAYNAGAGAVLQFGGVPPYPETEDYVILITDTVDNARTAWPAFWKDLLA